MHDFVFPYIKGVFLSKNYKTRMKTVIKQYSLAAWCILKSLNTSIMGLKKLWNRGF